MDRTEPHWRINSSFSPHPSRRWDCRFRSDGVSHETQGAPISGSSISSHSKRSRSVMSSDQYPNHHYSVSDGALSYFGSPYDNFQAPRWTPPSQRFDHGEFSTPTGGARPKNSLFAQCTEKASAAGASSVSNSLDSASPPSESSRWACTSKRPVHYPPRNFSGRRSFMSKPVYPLIYRNPVSDGEVYGSADASIGSRMTLSDNRASPLSPEGTSSPELKFHKALTELQKMEASPEPGTSSRREGFRWSNASSYDFGFDGDAIDVTVESLRSPYNSARHQRCGLCDRLLCQKSPWSSHHIVRSSDMPIAGVLPCRHVFHAECLEETTPRGQIHEPPCPTCLKAVGNEGSTSFSEPLQVPRRFVHGSPGVHIASKGEGSSSNPNPGENEGNLRRNQSLPMSRRGGSLVKNHFKKKFSFKGKVGKDLFGTKIFGRSASSLPSLLHEDRNQSGCSRARQSSRLSGSRA